MHNSLMKGAIINFSDNICVCPRLKAGATTKADATFQHVDNLSLQEDKS